MKNVLGDENFLEKEGKKPNGKSLILIVEDDKFLRDLISKKLVGEGYRIALAVDGKEALTMIGQEKPDLILLDIILPGMNGFDVLKQIKEDSNFSDIPVLILSNLSQSEDVVKGFKLGAVDFLVKAHFTPAQIIDRIKQILK